jgi:hypothetical protein
MKSLITVLLLLGSSALASDPCIFNYNLKYLRYPDKNLIAAVRAKGYAVCINDRNSYPPATGDFTVQGSPYKTSYFGSCGFAGSFGQVTQDGEFAPLADFHGTEVYLYWLRYRNCANALMDAIKKMPTCSWALATQRARDGIGATSSEEAQDQLSKTEPN